MRRIGIYIHVPFCETKCPYCDFYSLAKSSLDSLDPQIHDQYTHALLDCMGAFAQKDMVVDTIYFGGGTPLLLTPRNLSALIEGCSRFFSLSPDLEITLETNPHLLTKENLADCKAAGINRLSIGMQSGDEEELLTLGRNHSAQDLFRAVGLARAAGFFNLSLDMIIGAIGQTWKSLQKTLQLVADCQPEHLSAYLLKIEEGTPYATYDSALFLGEEMVCDYYLAVCEQLEKMGLYQYEISNFAKKDKASRHNLKYWRCEEYLGLGPSAHSFLDGKRFSYPRSLTQFLERQNDCLQMDDATPSILTERIMLGLRLSEGLPLEEVIPPTGLTPQLCRDHIALLQKVKSYEKAGLLTLNNGRVALTKKGFLVSNSLIAEFLSFA